jgi:hypothetical protein
VLTQTSRLLLFKFYRNLEFLNFHLNILLNLLLTSS